MNITEDQYICLHSIAIQMIEFDIKNGIEIKVVNINYYIDRAMKSLMLQCDDDVRLRLFADIEYRYNISHERGSAIFNDYDNKREWYSKMQIDNPYFWMRYKEYLINNTTVSPRSINLLDEETLPDIMNCLGNPNKEFNGKSFRRGLIIGDVQSGKTATYTGLICKAADAGYKVVILLAGITESLRRQTQKRIDEGIVGITVSKDGKKINKERIGVGLDNKTLRATSFTSRASDFVGNYDKIAMSLNTNNSLVLFVVKKNVSILQKLYKWLKEQNIDSVKGYVDEPMLLIDDEADNASVNTNKYETDPTKTNKLIRQICTLFKNSSYVGFTATPFANVFIDPDSVDSMQNADLFPEHFIYALESPSNYVGSKQIFYPEGKYYSNLRYITDIQEPDYTSDEYKEDSKYALDELNSGTFYYRHSKDWDGILPDSLEDAVMCFFLVNAIRDLRGQKSSHRSMLVNMSRFINVQRIIAEHIEQIFDKTFNEIRFNFGETISENEKLPLCQKLFSIWQKHFSHIHDIDFADIVKKSVLIEAIEKIKVLVINGSKQSGKLDYSDKSKPLRVIAVGGLALSRGLTLEGLIISYFYRNSATFDVLMQMGRWFGYREGYEDLFQIWTSKTSAQWYAEVARASHELKDDIRNMFEQRLTPKDFGIKVYDNCRDLQITASNKMRTAKGIEMQYSFYGNIYDTPYITYNVEHNRHNLQQIENLAGKLFTNGYRFVFADLKKESKDVNDKGDGSSRLFADVPKDEYPVIGRNNETERSDEHERADIHDAGRVPSAQPAAPAGAGGDAWEIRPYAAPVSAAAPQSDLHQPSDQREADGASAGDRADGEIPDGADHSADGESRGRDGGAESGRHDGVGRQGELHQGEDRRDHQGADDLRLTEEQPPKIDFAAVPLSEVYSARGLTKEQWEALEAILRHGGGRNRSRLRIAYEFMSGRDPEAFAV